MTLLPTILICSLQGAPNTCESGGVGDTCAATEDCERNAYATVCVNTQCEIPCIEANECALGERCIAAESDIGEVSYCDQTAFRMDLNLLDMCVSHFTGGVLPNLTGNDLCSLERNLNQLLDQDANSQFNIFDVHGCIAQFYYGTACGPSATEGCPLASGLRYCGEDTALNPEDIDTQCGAGLYCDTESNHCARDCGYIANREVNGIDYLERPCFGDLTTCNYDRGQCVPVELEGRTCQVDRDCPNGAYCFLGECAPRCSRAIDCPQGDWYCTPTNRCEPVPKPSDDAGFSFDPQEYALHFGQRLVTLTEINDRFAIPVVVMNIRSKREVFDTPSVAFGYRLETTYGRKGTAFCEEVYADVENASPADIESCYIAPEEEFLTLAGPFGTVSATAQPTIDVRLNHQALELLDPGTYQVQLGAIFNNGSRASTSIQFEKQGLSGSYTGRVTVYYDDAETNRVGTSNLSITLSVAVDAEEIQWIDLLHEQNLDDEIQFNDTTSGFPVIGFIDGSDSPIFNQTDRSKDNRIAVKGVYSTELRRMRLVGVVDLPKEFCVSDAGECSNGAFELTADNVFDRDIRRVFYFDGPYDDRARVFNGVFRDTFMGLIPDGSNTLDGGFILSQVSADESGAQSDPDLLSPLSTQPSSNPDYPERVDLLQEANTEIERYCRVDDSVAEDSAGVFDAFSSRENFQRYLEALDTTAPILSDLIDLNGEVGRALTGLADTNTAALTLHEYLRGQILPCEEDNANPETCINEVKALCGLALHRKAYLEGWIDTENLGFSFPGGDELFCRSGSELPGCHISATERGDLVALQEHNRFFQSLAEAKRFQASADLSEAFFTLYRNAGESIAQAEALSEKQAALFSAWDRYDELRRYYFSPASSEIMFYWPMAGFKSRGQPWLDQVHAILGDRLDALEEIVDLKRRVFLVDDTADFDFVQQLLQLEYFSHVYLMALQRKWQGQRFHYAGQGPAAIEAGEQIVAQLNDTKNPLGFNPEQVFFENSALELRNWENYRAQLTSGGISGAGMLGDVEQSIQIAITELRGSLSDQSSFEAQLLNARQHFEAEIDAYCGPEELLPGSVACEGLSAEDSQQQSGCRGESCDYQFICDNEGEDCDSVIQIFEEAADRAEDTVSCRLDSLKQAIEVGGGVERSCMRGQVGALMEERAQLDVQRTGIQRQVEIADQQVRRLAQEIADTREAGEDYLNYVDSVNDEMQAIQLALLGVDLTYQLALNSARSLDCLIIVGFSNGTDCAGKAASAGLVAAATAAKYAATEGFALRQTKLQTSREERQIEFTQDATLRAQRLELNNAITSAQNLITEYEMVLQQLANIERRINDTVYLAQRAADRYDEQLAQIVEHLLGTEDGNILRRNKAVQEANTEFLNVIRTTYKMAAAFIHSYNVKELEDTILNQVFEVVTPSGVYEFIDSLETFERNYCGDAGIDCDAPNNVQTLRYSIRERLFPGLTDIVDPDTGDVLSIGEQFHNIITGSGFTRRRVRGPLTVSQIEIPLAVVLNDLGDVGEDRYMVPPLECNHIMVGSGNGTIGVNVVGTRLQTLSYEFKRGNTDYIRGCTLENITPPGGGLPRLDYPINRFIIGYAPQNALANEPSAPEFQTRSGTQVACRNRLENSQGIVDDESCYRYFARDRSLSSTDWELVIPTELDGNDWIAGDGLSDSERPIVEDIVLYFRYRTRPTSD